MSDRINIWIQLSLLWSNHAYIGIHFNQLGKTHCLLKENMSSNPLKTKRKVTPFKFHLSTISFRKIKYYAIKNMNTTLLPVPMRSKENGEWSNLLPVEILTALYCSVTDELFHPGFPLLNSMLLKYSLWILQSYGCIVVQLLQTASQHRAPLLQEGTDFPLQLLTLADQVGLASILQKGCCWHIAWRTFG